MPPDAVPGAAPVRTIVVVPVYNERDTCVSVLERVVEQRVVSELVVVDDGSTDGSGSLIAAWANGRPGVTVLRHERNRGYSEALLTAFAHLTERMGDGGVGPRDIVATVDADDQHDPAQLGEFVAYMIDGDWDVVWARRDFSRYPLWKRMGNGGMALIGSAFAGVRFRDVESGYCLFRLRPLDHALSFGIKETRYSLSLTLAVLFGRLGYRVSDEPIAKIRLYRSRTRLIDVFVDTRAAFRAWVAVAGRQRTLVAQTLISTAVLGSLAAAIVLVASKRVYLGFDSINNYAHVWYISARLFSGSLPLRFDALDGGSALTYPYGFVPWTLAALLRPIAGDFAVTWVAVAGFVALLAVVYTTRLNRSGWLLTLFVALPFTSQMLLNFQVSFFWGLLFGFLYASALDRGSAKWSALWLAGALLTHVVVMGPLLAAYTAWVFWRQPGLRKRLVWLSAAMTIPVALLSWYTFQTPTVVEADHTHVAQIIATTLLQRGLVFALPFVLPALHPSRIRVVSAAGGVAGGAALIAFSLIWNSRYASYQGLFAAADDGYGAYLADGSFVAGAVYRVDEPPGRESGEYEMLRHGAGLASEFFDESRYHRDWSLAGYQCFLDAKNVDFVLLNGDYTRATGYNEQQALDALVDEGLAKTAYQDASGRFTVYDVRGVRAAGGDAGVNQCLKL